MKDKKPCVDCGATLTQEDHQNNGGWARKIRCDSCEDKAKKERNFEAKARYNQKHGLPVNNTPISEIEYGKDILVFIKGEQVKRHYDEIYCVGCGGFIEVRRVMSGPRKGDLPRSAEHNIRKTHGGKCQYLYMQKMFSKKLPEEFEEIEQPKNRRYTAVPARGEVWGTFKPKRITLIEKHLDMFDLWIEGKVGHVVRKVKLRLAA